jgi:Omp85 superfamily domain/WD40-like Beta Propeller Repeat
MYRPRRVDVLLLALSLVAVEAPGAHAQYFGRNKVQYETFDIYFYPQEEALAQHVARMAERWYDRLSRVLDLRLSSRQPLVLYASHPHFEQTNVIAGLLGEGTGGVTEGLRRRIVLPAAASLAETDHVIGHELVHAFQYDAGSRNPQRTALLPLWFVEGMAEYLSIGPDDAHTAMWMRDAVFSEELPTIRQLSHPKYFPYRYGQALWAYLANKYGDRIIGNALFAAGGGDAVGAIESVTGKDEKTLTAEWHQMLRQLYGPYSSVTKVPADVGTPLITDDGTGGELNVSPALSPDGKRLVFLSERGRLSIDMYLADATNGRILQKLVATASDPHFESLQFISSAGSWDPTGKRFVFAAIRRGQPHLAILDADRGRIEREIGFKELGEIYHPTWSPDGRRIAFSAIAGGVSDLYLYDLQFERLSKLTDDLYADLQPAWSPDGREIAFVTDRYTTDLKTLHYRSYRLALLNMTTRNVRELPALGNAKHIDPQWSSDSATLFFLSDQTGITNIYRLQIATGTIAQLTNISTGVTGITHLSPALSVATRTGRLAFSAYRKSKYEIFTVESAMQMTAIDPATIAPTQPIAAAKSGTPVPITPASALAPLRPPSTNPMDTALRGSQLSTVLGDPLRGLPADTETFSTKDYKPKLQLDYVGQPYVVAGADRFGTFVGGGVSFLLSDMLGDHVLAAAAQVQGEFDTFAGQLGYLNRKSRWNWGGVAEQIPYLTGAFSERLDTVNGEPALVQQVYRYNQIHRQISGVVAYPFSQARRVEFTSGLRQISFNRRVDEQIYSLQTGRLISDDRRDLSAPGSVTLAEMGMALVYDTSLYGPTSPILGRRYRIEVSPTVGDLTFTSLLADMRQYYMPVKPITIAGRFLHYGRYGTNSDDIRLTPVFVGYPHLVRGYDFNSFRVSECVPESNSSCPAFDRLVGSRLMVANAEVRFPLLGVLKREFIYGPVPIEGVVFGDAGVAWTRDQKPSFAGGTREVVRSVGAGVRVNALGFAILEFDAVRPLDRPGRGWMFAFNFVPGF